jgi:hypothetical protein
LKQYIADFEDIIINDSDDEDAIQYFDDLSRDVIIHNTEDCESRVLMIKRSQK